MKPEKIKKPRRMGISAKVAWMLILFAAILCTAAIALGRMTFDNNIKKQYNNTAYKVAHAVEAFFEPGELGYMARLAFDYANGEGDADEVAALLSSERYQYIYRQLVSLRRSMEANDIFISVPDFASGKPIIYIMDSYVKEDLCFAFGDRSPMSEEYLEDSKQAFLTGVHTSSFQISTSEFGHNTTASYPVMEDGKGVAFINVEIPMQTLESAISAYTRRTILITVLVTIVLLAINIIIWRYTFIRTIKTVAEEAEKFVDNNTEVSRVLATISTGDELEDLGRSIYHMEKDIREYIDNLQKVTAEKERIGAELSIAAQIQVDMLPRIFPAFPGWKEFEIYATMIPAKEVGGDFYDYFLVDDTHIALVMADVSGKGVPAALFMVIAKTLIKNRTQMGGTPAQILHDVNNQLCEGNEAELFVTVWLAVIDVRTGKGIAANAGHEHPVVRRSGGDYETVIYRHSPAVATMEDLNFREHEFELHPGDSLFVYTDGVAEATNKKNELFGMERTLEALNRNKNASARGLLTAVKQEIDNFVGDAPQFDDITMLIFKYMGK